MDSITNLISRMRSYALCSVDDGNIQRNIEAWADLLEALTKEPVGYLFIPNGDLLKLDEVEQDSYSSTPENYAPVFAATPAPAVPEPKEQT